MSLSEVSSLMYDLAENYLERARSFHPDILQSFYETVDSVEEPAEKKKTILECMRVQGVLWNNHLKRFEQHQNQ